MHHSAFREYDIRGIVGNDFNIEESYQLGQAIMTFFKQQYPQDHTVVIGRDGRSHSSIICSNIINAARHSGYNVIDIGVVPSPVLYFSVHQFQTPLGLVITASHNPKEYNGIKIWGVWGEKIQQIYHLYKQKKILPQACLGSYQTYDAITSYVNYLYNHFPSLHNISIRALIDCGNGTAGTVFPALIKKFCWNDVDLLYETVDGTFPHHEADPTVMKNMLDLYRHLQQNKQFTIGIGLDGDCDRMSPITPEGNLIPGDKLLGIFAQDILTHNPTAPIICDIKSSSALFEFLDTLHATYHISPSGHSIIKQEMITHKGIVAGELSCHFFFNDRYFGYDDGIYASLRLLELLQKHNRSLDELITQFPHRVSSREIRIPCSSETIKKEIVGDVHHYFAARPYQKMITIDGMRVEQEYGWGLIRASNTQPVICLRFESDEQSGLTQIKQEFYAALKLHLNEHILKEYLEL